MVPTRCFAVIDMKLSLECGPGNIGLAYVPLTTQAPEEEIRRCPPTRVGFFCLTRWQKEGRRTARSAIDSFLEAVGTLTTEASCLLP